MSEGATLLELIGIDPDELRWHNLAQCRGMDREIFYDKYEADVNVAKITDEICLSCPVLQECLTAGIENNEHGVWGGIYLTSGKPDMNKNEHKTEQVWNELRERIGEVL